MECGRNHAKGKPQVKREIVLDHEVLISEAELTSKTTFTFNTVGSFCDSHKKCFICHVLSGVSLCQAQDQLWVDAKQQMYTRGPSMPSFTCTG